MKFQNIFWEDVDEGPYVRFVNKGLRNGFLTESMNHFE